jgi:hypothetical protein
MSTGAGSQRRLGRSVLAVVVGFVVVLAITLLTDGALEKTGILPKLGEPLDDRASAIATAYRLLYAVLGTYLTARLAPYRPMLHAMIGGAIGLVLSIVGAVVTWNMNLGPHWYPLALIVTALPCAWVAGKIRESQLRVR